MCMYYMHNKYAPTATAILTGQRLGAAFVLTVSARPPDVIADTLSDAVSDVTASVTTAVHSSARIN